MISESMKYSLLVVSADDQPAGFATTTRQLRARTHLIHVRIVALAVLGSTSQSAPRYCTRARPSRHASTVTVAPISRLTSGLVDVSRFCLRPAAAARPSRRLRPPPPHRTAHAARNRPAATARPRKAERDHQQVERARQQLGHDQHAHRDPPEQMPRHHCGLQKNIPALTRVAGNQNTRWRATPFNMLAAPAERPVRTGRPGTYPETKHPGAYRVFIMNLAFCLQRKHGATVLPSA